MLILRNFVFNKVDGFKTEIYDSAANLFLIVDVILIIGNIYLTLKRFRSKTEAYSTVPLICMSWWLFLYLPLGILVPCYNILSNGNKEDVSRM